MFISELQFSPINSSIKINIIIFSCSSSNPVTFLLATKRKEISHVTGVNYTSVESSLKNGTGHKENQMENWVRANLSFYLKNKAKQKTKFKLYLVLITWLHSYTHCSFSLFKKITACQGFIQAWINSSRWKMGFKFSIKTCVCQLLAANLLDSAF